MKSWTHDPDKDWGAAPDGQKLWVDEPDAKSWTDAATGLRCIAQRQVGLGHWCGLVGVMAGHPLFGASIGKGDAALAGLSVHGGVTWTGACFDGPVDHLCDEHDEPYCHAVAPGDTWLLGFECNLRGDYLPRFEASCRERDMPLPRNAGDYSRVYRPLSFVEAECARLAAQLAAVVPDE